MLALAVAISAALPMAVASSSGAQTTVVAESDTVGQPSPSGAFWRSVAFPGWGQWYNRQPTRAIAYASVIGVCAGMAARNWSTGVGAEGEGSVFWKRDGWTKGRNNWLILGAITYILCAADAYVEAHMKTFDVSPVAVEFRPMEGRGTRLVVSVPVADVGARRWRSR